MWPNKIRDRSVQSPSRRGARGAGRVSSTWPGDGFGDDVTTTVEVILVEVRERLQVLRSLAEWEAFKATVLGPKGSFTGVMKGIRELPREERPAFGRRLNEVKREAETLFGQALERIKESEMVASLGPPIDPTLPGGEDGPGTRHIISQVGEEICQIFRRIGFAVEEGSEIETEFFCFDALNTPPDHPARDLQDTYYLHTEAKVANVSKRNAERYLLRTHTSTVQIRTMLERQPPLRIISPGRVFRRDTADATHAANFHQIEGLYVDRKVGVTDLKATLDFFIKSLLGVDARTRFRPHFFPYTEPSFEVDFHSAHLDKVGTEWTEIMGCGIVHPAVFEAVGYDPREWSGFAFGMGIERIAMVLTGVDDIRYFYQNDLRLLRQFRPEIS